MATINPCSGKASPITELVQAPKHQATQQSNHIKKVALATLYFMGVAALTVGSVALGSCYLTPENNDQPLKQYHPQYDSSYYASFGALAVAGVNWLAERNASVTQGINPIDLTPDVEIPDPAPEKKLEIQSMEAIGFSQDQISTLVNSLEDIFESGREDELQEIGMGWSKRVYTHQELPGVVIKQSRKKSFFLGDKNHIFLQDFLSGKQIKAWLSENKKDSRVLIPDMIYLQTSLGEFLIQTKLDIRPFSGSVDPMEFLRLENELQLCDLDFFEGRNAGVTFKKVDGVKQGFIGIIDFDCRMGSYNKEIIQEIEARKQEPSHKIALTSDQ